MMLTSTEISWSLSQGDGSQLTTMLDGLLKEQCWTVCTILVSLACYKKSRESSFNSLGY